MFELHNPRRCSITETEFKEKKFRNISRRKRCLQYWDSSWPNKSNVSNAQILLHDLQRSYLKIEKDVVIDNIIFMHSKGNAGCSEDSQMVEVTNDDHTQLSASSEYSNHEPLQQQVQTTITSSIDTLVIFLYMFKNN